MSLHLFLSAPCSLIRCTTSRYQEGPRSPDSAPLSFPSFFFEPKDRVSFDPCTAPRPRGRQVQTETTGFHDGLSYPSWVVRGEKGGRGESCSRDCEEERELDCLFKDLLRSRARLEKKRSNEPWSEWSSAFFGAD